MIRMRNRRQASLLWFAIRERARRVVVLVILIAACGWLMTNLVAVSTIRCRGGYAYARTAADTLTVDSWRAGTKGTPGWLACAHLRRSGALDDHGQTERRP